MNNADSYSTNDLDLPSPEQMRLPVGKHCGDCRHFDRCSWLIQKRPMSNECDWWPVRFNPSSSATPERS